MSDPATARESLNRLYSWGRTGRSTDGGDLAAFLAGPHSAFTTGATVVIDGGRTAQLPTPH